MKKALKITGITLATLVGVVLIVASVAIYLVFTPERLTPIVRKALPEFVTCQTGVDKAELTFFSTFPQFGLELNEVCLKNPMQGANDTLAFVDKLVATVDAWAFLTKNEVQLNAFYLKNTIVNVFVDTCGNTNYNIFPPSEEEDTSAFVNPFDVIALDAVQIENLTATYNDLQQGLSAKVEHSDCSIKAQLSDVFDGKAALRANIKRLSATMAGEQPVVADVADLNLDVNAAKTNNAIDGKLVLNLPDASLKMGESELLVNRKISFDIPLSASIDVLSLELKKAKISLENHEIGLNGTASYSPNSDIAMDVDFATNKWVVSEVLSLIPKEYVSLLDGIDVDGNLHLSGNVTGVYNDSVWPKVAANLLFEKGKFAYEGIPYRLREVFADMSADLDLNKDSVSSATITNLSAKTGTSRLQVSGVVNDLLGAIRCNLNLKGDVNLPELKPLLADMNVRMEGRTKANVNARFALDDVLNLNLNKIRASGNLAFTGVDVVYEDSMLLKSPDLKLSFALPSNRKNKGTNELIAANIEASAIDFEMIETMAAKIDAVDLVLGVSNIMDTTVLPSVACLFDMKRLQAKMDTITADVLKPNGEVSLSPSQRNKKNPHIKLEYSSESLVAAMGSFLDVKTDYVKIKASTTYNEKQDNLYLKWNPTFDIDFNNGAVKMAGLAHAIQIPLIKFNLTPRDLHIDDSRIVIADSDFKLSGNATNIRKFMRKKGDLVGEFNFISEKTNINQLLDIVNGFGGENEENEADELAENTPETTEEANPFMVPKRIDLTLNTKIKKAVFDDIVAENLGGKIMIKDGVAVLEQMGFTCDAANMQLTALYRSDRRNHLFAGLDFHLLNIDIKQLIDMIPDIDTIIPMLKSFEGRAEFHLAAETYMKSNYDLKMSTLRGAAAIEGKNLVLLDSETFAKIAKPLLFNRKTKNLVDSISVEATVFRNEVDLYPFVMSMDKYSAVVGGRYDLSQNYNAHIETLAPIRLALRITGNAANLDDMHFDLVKTKYGNMYKPEKRNALQERTLALKKLISDALKSTVKEQDEEDN